MDLSKYDIKLSIKAICMFEKLTGKSFYDFNTEDILILMYCAFMSSNNINLKLSTFYIILEDERVMKWVMKKADEIFEVLEQFMNRSEGKKEEGEEPDKKMTITDITNTLIIDYGLSAEWVMSKMELWQIEDLYKVAEEKVKNRYTEERLWTYLSILPHVDGKKLTSPDKLLQFPWEKDIKEKELNEVEAKAAFNFLKPKEENGKRRLDNSPGQEGLPESTEDLIKNE